MHVCDECCLFNYGKGQQLVVAVNELQFLPSSVSSVPVYDVLCCHWQTVCMCVPGEQCIAESLDSLHSWVLFILFKDEKYLIVYCGFMKIFFFFALITIIIGCSENSHLFLCSECF